jgi:alkylhydroperoxidase family enzyme
MDNRRKLVDEMIGAVGNGAGTLDPQIRADLLAGKRVSGPLGELAVQVVKNAKSITDDDVAALLRAGFSEDQVFECIVAAACGAGLARLRAGLALLEEGQ